MFVERRIFMFFNWDDEDFKDALKNYLSCALPHENYDPRFFNEVINKLFKLIRLEEMSVEFKVLCSSLYNLSKISITVEGYEPKMTRDDYINIISYSFDDFVAKNSKEIQRFMSVRGYDFDYAIPEQQQQAKEQLFNEALDLYDDCFSRKTSSSQFPAVLLALRSAFKTNANRFSLECSFRIMNEGLFQGKKVYKGDDGYMEYVSNFLSEIRGRLDDSEEGIGTIDSIEKIYKMREMNKVQSSRICDYGIPQVDDYTPMLRSRLQVIIGTVNVGKTAMCCNLAAKLIMEGKKVLYWPGESGENEIKNRILSSYIRRKYNRYVMSAQIAGIDSCDEEAQILINKADIDLVNLGGLTFLDNLTYDNFYDDAKAAYEKNKFDVLIVDHSGTLKTVPGSKLYSTKDRIDSLAVQARMFKKDFPVDVIISSHPSTNAEDDIRKYGYIRTSTGSTKGSNDLDKEADDIFVLVSNPSLVKAGLVEFYTKKRRLATPYFGKILLNFNTQVQYFEYDPSIQADVKGDLAEDQALQEITDEIDVDSNGETFDIGSLI